MKKLVTLSTVIVFSFHFYSSERTGNIISQETVTKIDTKQKFKSKASNTNEVVDPTKSDKPW
ncbi:hypothetical protein [Chryseobacterium sp. BIGb0232]|uniref:hypothetical protein n=1 Tax=Chryseobacterium sp. BIGb0232 TaxID=2940598 RepID=UPI000F471540|nr:hypothetical protein [Chryseobacterium sp. BIGb0232]MCS4302553.1 hypothetical protein [Chryseobacterium sp. BIGb0232]ROS17208.1 hypothetical protein EDF65_1570 [Chryseobacterium nakagawai]